MNLINSYNICFLGRTGNGKTSLINKLFNTKFSTDPLLSCTKEMYSVTIMAPENDRFEAVTVYDTPGIGEFSSDSKYEKYYQHAIYKANCIVLVTTFDRTDAPTQRLLKRLNNYVDNSKSTKLIVALNHIDSKIITDKDGKYEPWNNEKNIPSEQCFNNIKERIEIIHQKFDNKFLPFDVVPVCAKRDYGLTELKNKILNI